MKTIEYRTVDKSTWAPGPWLDEPDKMQWQDEATGLPCLIVRNPVGALCGYVGVPPKHPWHGIGYNTPIDGGGETSPESLMEVHGGLTFSDACSHGKDESVGVCHKPAPGEPDNVWWFGFDCAHADDYCPSPRMSFFPNRGNVYRNLAYVQRECARLAMQLSSRQSGAVDAALAAQEAGG